MHVWFACVLREAGSDHCPLLLQDQVWRFITYMLVHAGVSHILFNILIQVQASTQHMHTSVGRAPF